MCKLTPGKFIGIRSSLNFRDLTQHSKQDRQPVQLEIEVEESFTKWKFICHFIQCLPGYYWKGLENIHASPGKVKSPKISVVHDIHIFGMEKFFQFMNMMF